MKRQKFECPFINSAGARCIVTVELADEEVCICRLSPHTADNIARAYAARRAVRQLPAGFTAFDLMTDQILSHSVH
jgi:hypothetical protein